MNDRYFRINSCEGDGEYALTLEEMMYEYNEWKKEYRDHLDEDGMPKNFDEWFEYWFDGFDCYGEEITKEEYEQLKAELNKEE